MERYKIIQMGGNSVQSWTRDSFLGACSLAKSVARLEDGCLAVVLALVGEEHTEICHAALSPRALEMLGRLRASPGYSPPIGGEQLALALMSMSLMFPKFRETTVREVDL